MSMPSSGMETALAQLDAMAARAAGQQSALNPPGTAGQPSFGAALYHAIDSLDGVKEQATAKAHAFETGQPGVSLPEVMIAQQKASLVTKFDMRVRDQVVGAYRQIMNMQI